MSGVDPASGQQWLLLQAQFTWILLTSLPNTSAQRKVRLKSQELYVKVLCRMCRPRMGTSSSDTGAECPWGAPGAALGTDTSLGRSSGLGLLTHNPCLPAVELFNEKHFQDDSQGGAAETPQKEQAAHLGV